MKAVAPAGTMYQAGTLSGNPLAMTAGLATIRGLLEPGVFEAMEEAALTLLEGIEAAAESAKIPIQAGCVGSMFGVYFLKEPSAAITDYTSAKQFAHTERYARFFHAMLDAGIYFAPSQFEAGFVSSAHTEDVIENTLAAVKTAFATLAS
jgi:glutamate-1-semialdehyde 2,1-aminomutase